MQLGQPAHEQNDWLRRWSRLWTLVLVAPAALTVSSMSPAMAAATLGGGIFVVGVTVLAMTAESVQAAPYRLPDAVRFAVCAVVTCLGFGGLIVHAPSLASVMFAAYVTTAVWVIITRNVLPKKAAAAPVAPEAPEEAMDVPVVVTTADVHTMTDGELCLAWRRSFVTLTATFDPARRAHVVALRQVILDELELRHSAGLHAWLHSGARAASGPDRFLGGSNETRPPRAA